MRERRSSRLGRRLRMLVYISDKDLPMEFSWEDLETGGYCGRGTTF